MTDLEDKQINFIINGNIDEFKKSVNDFGINYLNFDGHNDFLLRIACLKNNFEIVKFIINLPIDIQDIKPSLITCLQKENIQIFDFLLKTGLEKLDDNIFNQDINNKIAEILIFDYNIIPKKNNKYYSIYQDYLKIKISAAKYILDWWRHYSYKPGSKKYFILKKRFYDNIL